MRWPPKDPLVRALQDIIDPSPRSEWMTSAERVRAAELIIERLHIRGYAIKRAAAYVGGHPEIPLHPYEAAGDGTCLACTRVSIDSARLALAMEGVTMVTSDDAARWAPQVATEYERRTPRMDLARGHSGDPLPRCVACGEPTRTIRDGTPCHLRCDLP